MAGGARGLYEMLVTEALAARLGEIELEPRTDALRAAEAPDRIALHIGALVRRALGSVPDKERAAVGIELARQLIAVIDEAVLGRPQLVGQLLHRVGPPRLGEEAEDGPLPDQLRRIRAPCPAVAHASSFVSTGVGGKSGGGILSSTAAPRTGRWIQVEATGRAPAAARARA